MKGLGSDVREFGSHAEGHGKPLKDLIQGKICPVLCLNAEYCSVSEKSARPEL